MGDQEHFLTTGKASPHYVESALDNGGCLTGHASSYRENESCSYRWQAVARSRTNRRPIYNLELTKEDEDRVAGERDPSAKVRAGFLKTSAYFSKDKKTGKKKNLNPPGYATRIQIPKDPKEWWIETGRNFEGFIKPYWNNAHHMIPKGLFNQVLDANNKEKPQIRDLVVSSLVETRYNINHHKNVILLPQDKEVGLLFRLPRHLVLEDDTEIEEKGSPKFNHAKYSMTLERRLRVIIQNYKNACDDALRKDCKTKLITLSTKQLETLSRDCYVEITEHARTGRRTGLRGGAPLSELRAIRRLKHSQIAGMPY